MLISYTDAEPDKVEPILIDRLAIEKRGLGSVPVIESGPLLYASRLAHAALVRTGATDQSFDDWVGRVADIDMDEPDPTPQGHGTDSDSN